jgi:hypothetical protein
MAWAAYDAHGVTTAMLSGLLGKLFPDPMAQTQLLTYSAPADLALVETDLGFAFWALADSSELDAICAAIQAVRFRHPDTVQVVCFEPTLAESVPLLVEAGAQIVVSQLPSLELAIRHAASHFPLSSRGAHPLTRDLFRLIPWT